jgi:hypothetical protein
MSYEAPSVQLILTLVLPFVDVFLLKFAAVCSLPVPSKTGLKRLEDMVKINLGTNHQLPSIENPEQYRTLARKDPVYRLMDFLLSNDWTHPWIVCTPLDGMADSTGV